MGTPWGEQEGRAGRESGSGGWALVNCWSLGLAGCTLRPWAPGLALGRWSWSPPSQALASHYLLLPVQLIWATARHFCSFPTLAPLFLSPNGGWDNPPHLKHLGGEERVLQTQHQRARSPEGLGDCFCFQFLSLGPCTNWLGSWAPARLLGCQAGFWAHHRWGEKAAL